MSKNAKQLDHSVDSGRPITPIIRTRRNNGILNPTPSHAKLMIGKQESPYSRIQSITKTRSTSNLKNKSPMKLKTVSPNRSSNYSIALKSNDSKRSLFERKENNESKQTSLSNSYQETKKESIIDKLGKLKKESNLIEIKLNERLTEYQNSSDSTNSLKKLDIFRSSFDEIIQKDKVFSSILAKIKAMYEGIINKQSNTKKIKEYKEAIKDLSRNLNSQIDANKSQEKKIEKIIKENQELSKSLERSEEICTEIQKKLCFITNFNASEIPKDEMKWKALLLENRNYSEAYSKLKDDIKNYKYKEKKLLQLILALKQRGYPVEEVYDSEVEKKKHKPMPHYSGSEDLESNSEAENIVSGRPLVKDKPGFIPNLKLAEIEPESVSSSNFSSGTSESY